jgi:aromatic ring-opening dioxygenase catalytic subunit (LigB family)
MSSSKSVFVNHGGGPLPLMGAQPGVASFLSQYLSSLPTLPRAILVISAHYISSSSKTYFLNTNPSPSLLFDYSGFPPETYKYTHNSPRPPVELLDKLKEVLAPLKVTPDPSRNHDHGVFVPLKLLDPSASIPILSLSLSSSLDPEDHINLGELLRPLKDYNVLILGSGSSFHHMPTFFAQGAAREKGMASSITFNDWLIATTTKLPYNEAKQKLINWRSELNDSYACHPEGGEEHFIPLLVTFGAGGSPGTVIGVSESDASAIGGGIAMSNIEWD